MQSDGHQVADLKRTADVAQDYAGLQGLILAGTGVGLLAIASFSLVVGAVVIACSVVLGHTYYSRRFGTASSRPDDVVINVAGSVAATLIVLVGLVLDVSRLAPVAWGALCAAPAFALIALVDYRHVGATVLHWLLIGALLLAGLLPLAIPIADRSLWRYSLSVIGIALVVQGLFDHLRLVRALDPRR